MKYVYPPGAQPLPGFTIQSGIGRGGFGEVYHAVTEGGKHVALKLVQRHLDIELRGVRQCLNLKHPNLMGLYDIIEADNGDCWVVMEHMEGESLDRVLLRHHQGMPPHRAMEWLVGICDAVGYLHDQGIVHRDLKPGNVFMTQGQVKLGDYGLTKFIRASHRSGQTTSIGTVHYMAPEVAQGRYGKEIDLYSIGVMFYELLTGRVPFEGETVGEILMKHLTAAPDLRRVPAEYRQVVGKLLEKDPQHRYHDVKQLLADLGESPAEPLVLPRPGAAPVAVVRPDHPIVLAETTEGASSIQGSGLLPASIWVQVVLAMVLAVPPSVVLAVLGINLFRYAGPSTLITIGGYCINACLLFLLLRMFASTARPASGKNAVPPVSAAGSLGRQFARLALGVVLALGAGLVGAGFMDWWTDNGWVAMNLFGCLAAATFIAVVLVTARSPLAARGELATIYRQSGGFFARLHWFPRFALAVGFSLGLGLFLAGFVAGVIHRDEELAVLVGLGSGMVFLGTMIQLLTRRALLRFLAAPILATGTAMLIGAILGWMLHVRDEGAVVMTAVGTGLGSLGLIWRFASQRRFVHLIAIPLIGVGTAFIAGSGMIVISRSDFAAVSVAFGAGMLAIGTQVLLLLRAPSPRSSAGRRRYHIPVAVV